MNNQHYFEVVKVVEKFKGKFDDAQRRIRVLKEELAMARATKASIEEAKTIVAKVRDDL